LVSILLVDGDQDEAIALGWSPDDGALWVEVRGKAVGSFKNAELAQQLFDLYLGPKVSSVSS